MVWRSLRLWATLLIFASANSVSPLETVEARPGQDVLLPCNYGDDGGGGARAPRPDTSVFWRDRGDAHLYDIIVGRPDPASQEERFRGRVDSFPERYAAGNFSLRLRGALPGDAGVYACHVPSLAFRQDVELRVVGQAGSGDASGAENRGTSRAAALHFDQTLPLLLGLGVLLLWEK